MGLENIFQYFRNKKFIRKFEQNPNHYDGEVLLANSEYCNAIIDNIILENVVVDPTLYRQ
jgi:hypothetical protein